MTEKFVYSADFTIQNLIDANVHLGHRTKIWNPDIKYNIYGSKNGIHIIDVRKTYIALQKVANFFYKAGLTGKKILFVGTNPQITSIIKEYATKCQQFYVNDRWLGGILTNWYTVYKSIKVLLSYNKIIENNENELSKKEIGTITKKRDKLTSSLGGIIEMKGRPDIIFVANTLKDNLAIKEAAKLGIPVVAIIDTNSDIKGVSYGIPGNDEGIQAMKLYLEIITKAILDGLRDDMKSVGIDVNSIIEKGKKSQNENKNTDSAGVGDGDIGEKI